MVGHGSPTNCNPNVAVCNPRYTSSGVVDKVDISPRWPCLDVRHSSGKSCDQADGPTSTAVVHHSPLGPVLGVCNANSGALGLQQGIKSR